MSIKVGKQTNPPVVKFKTRGVFQLVPVAAATQKLGPDTKAWGEAMWGAVKRNTPPRTSTAHAQWGCECSEKTRTFIWFWFASTSRSAGENATNGRIRLALPSAFLLCSFEIFNHPVSQPTAPSHSQHPLGTAP